VPDTSALEQKQPSPTENGIAPFGYIPNQSSFHSTSQHVGPGDNLGRMSLESDGSSTRRINERASAGSYGSISNYSYDASFDPTQYTNPLPHNFSDFNWNPNFNLSQGAAPAAIPALSPFDQPHPGMNNFSMGPQTPVQYSDYLYPPSSFDVDRSATGLNQQQHSELMHDLETQGTGQIQHMISASQAFLYPHGRGY
jgi:hypothetical protein